jgi:hypothetical protein
VGVSAEFSAAVTLVTICKLFSLIQFFLTLREEYRLRVYQNRVLRRIFESRKDEVTGGWRKLHNEERRDLYSSPSIIIIIKSRRIRWGGSCSTKGEKRNAYSLLIGKP